MLKTRKQEVKEKELLKYGSFKFSWFKQISWCFEGWLTGKEGEAYTCVWQCYSYYRNNSIRKLLWENLALTANGEAKYLAFQNPQNAQREQTSRWALVGSLFVKRHLTWRFHSCRNGSGAHTDPTVILTETVEFHFESGHTISYFLIKSLLEALDFRIMWKQGCPSTLPSSSR